MTPLERLIGRKANSVVNTIGVDVSESTPFYLTSSNSIDQDNETGNASFEAAVRAQYKANGIVFACIQARLMPFSEVRFQYQELRGGRPGRLFGNESLGLLEAPWTNATTGELLARMEQDASLAGNFYATVIGSGSSRRVRRLRPDMVTIVSGVRGSSSASAWDLNAEVLGYIYDPDPSTDAATFLVPEDVVHYSPIPDPDAQWRGMSWLTPLAREIQADGYATTHKQRFFENGASLSTVVSYDASIGADQFERYVAAFEASHRGPDNAYKTLHLGGGADVTVVGANLTQDFRAIQGAGETRIAAAAGVGAVIARFSEGLQGSALNQGNYNAAKRQFADMTLRPLWRSAAASLSKLVPVPTGSRLWYDARDVELLKDDRDAAADILSKTATTMRQLVDAGYTPDSVVTAVEAGDLSRLVHSGMYSVQLQAPGASTPAT